jgi:hypothetical protein
VESAVVSQNSLDTKEHLATADSGGEYRQHLYIRIQVVRTDDL